jgi:hypothetical protein
MYNLTIDTPANRQIAERLANNRIRSDMLFPTEPLHIMPHGIWSGGWRYTPYLLAGTNQQYPPLHMDEAMMISSGGMIHRPMSVYRGEVSGYGSSGGDISGGDISGGKGKKFLGMNTKQWKNVGKVAKSVGNVITPALIASNPELAPFILGANAGLQAIPTGAGMGRGITGGKKKNVLKDIGHIVNKSAKSVAKVAKKVWEDPAFQPVKSYGKQVAKEALSNVVQQYVAPQVEGNPLGQLAVHYGQQKASEAIEGAGRKRGRPKKVGAGISGGKKKNVLKDISKVVNKSAKSVAKVAKKVWEDPAFQPVKAQGKELAKEALSDIVQQYVAPQVEGNPLGQLAVQYGQKKASEAIEGAGRKRGRPKKVKAGAGVSGGEISGGKGSRQKRGEIVKEIMKSKGLKLAQASKYVKEHGLYKK